MINFNDIDIVVFDIDGVICNGKYQMHCRWIEGYDEPTISKTYYTRDFDAIERLLKNNIKVLILSGCHDKIMEAQLGRICSYSNIWKESMENGNLTLKTAIDDKFSELVDYLVENYKKLENVAYMGDAENDLICMKSAVYTACPANAIEEVRENSNYISDFNGGDGCVYDFVMYLLKKRGERYENSKS
jgi:3-deoxy-D-manno-octulosonate 8-phosphate phosphatase (KDO 8-P phosphatase)